VLLNSFFSSVEREQLTSVQVAEAAERVEIAEHSAQEATARAEAEVHQLCKELVKEAEDIRASEQRARSAERKALQGALQDRAEALRNAEDCCSKAAQARAEFQQRAGSFNKELGSPGLCPREWRLSATTPRLWLPAPRTTGGAEGGGGGREREKERERERAIKECNGASKSPSSTTGVCIASTNINGRFTGYCPHCGRPYALPE